MLVFEGGHWIGLPMFLLTAARRDSMSQMNTRAARVRQAALFSRLLFAVLVALLASLYVLLM
jgi:hypothetical protein